MKYSFEKGEGERGRFPCARIAISHRMAIYTKHKLCKILKIRHSNTTRPEVLTKSTPRKGKKGTLQRLMDTFAFREVVLADDVLCHIFSFLDFRALARACCVCKRWGMFGNEPWLWQGFDLWGIHNSIQIHLTLS